MKYTVPQTSDERETRCQTSRAAGWHPRTPADRGDSLFTAQLALLFGSRSAVILVGTRHASATCTWAWSVHGRCQWSAYSTYCVQTPGAQAMVSKKRRLRNKAAEEVQAAEASQHMPYVFGVGLLIAVWVSSAILLSPVRAIGGRACTKRSDSF